MLFHKKPDPQLVQLQQTLTLLLDSFQLFTTEIRNVLADAQRSRPPSTQLATSARAALKEKARKLSQKVDPDDDEPDSASSWLK